MRRLAARAAAAGADIREHEPVEDVDALDAERVLVATDGYGRALLPELADVIWPTRGQIVVSEPLDRVLYDRRTTPGRDSITGSSSRTGGCCSAASATSRSWTS